MLIFAEDDIECLGIECPTHAMVLVGMSKEVAAIQLVSHVASIDQVPLTAVPFKALGEHINFSSSSSSSLPLKS